MDGGSWHCTGDRDQDNSHGKKCKKEKWLSEEALQIALKRREAKSKGEKEIYTHLNAELQRIARRDKKAFITDQCKEIEENNRMEKTMQQWPQDWKMSLFIPIPKKDNAKKCSNYCTIALISHASKVMLKILQARLQQYVNCELPDIQAGFRKGRGTRDQIANIRWIIKKHTSSRKTSISALLTMPKPLTVWITINCGKFFKR